MDRQIVYPGSIPLDTDLLNTERDAMVAIGYLAQMVLGTNAVADGLACTPTIPASLIVTVGAGSITQFGVVDTTPFGSLPAANQPLLRMGVNLNPASFTLTAPTAAGQAINYLIEAAMLEADATPIVLPYYNPANPGQPYSGQGNSGAPQNTQRLQSVQLQLKAGAPANAGTQATPAVDANWSGLFVITVITGQTQITAGNIAAIPGAPFLATKLPQMTPGTRNLAVFSPTNQGNWVVPAGVSFVKLRVWGGGGAGGNATSGAGGGGGGGGYAEGFYPVLPGQSYFVTVGNGGVGSGTAGGTSSFGNLTTAAGGPAGGSGAGASGGGAGFGTGLVVAGGAGGSAFQPASGWVSGGGGAAYGGAGALSVTATGTNSINGHAATMPGGGGSGGIGTGLGGQGGAGAVMVEW